MHVDFLLGPAGSGKTFRCLTEIRAALTESPEGFPLVFLAPKQATFQLEREILSDPDLPGYTRLQILSFDRLAEFVLNQFFSAPPRLLSEEGRVMVLRALLARNYSKLKLFHASARFPGFAQQLSELLNEVQQHQISPEKLSELAAQNASHPQLRDKLYDLSLLLGAYLEWLKENELEDPNGRLELAAATVAKAARDSAFHLGGLWLDGFAELTPQELDLLAALIPTCDRVTLAFCFDARPEQKDESHSIWGTIGRVFRRCHSRLEQLPGLNLSVKVVKRHPPESRFAQSAALAHLEQHWALPNSEYTIHSSELGMQDSALATPPAVRIFTCQNREAEAITAAREILKHIRRGGRFRDLAVLVRSLRAYEREIDRVFTRYDIPFFIDRREPVSHHPMAELTRYALRVLVSNWEHDDWFGALKTGLVHQDQTALDHLENVALARGWKGNQWHNPLKLPDQPELENRLELLRNTIMKPFTDFAGAMEAVQRQPSGIDLATAIRDLWAALRVPDTLQAWTEAAASRGDSVIQTEIHVQAEKKIGQWLDNLELAFEQTRVPLGDWIPIIEAGLAGLTAGVIPLALDEVLIGQVDRSRNPNLEVVLLLGLNETVFPAPPAPAVLLNEHDREALNSAGVRLGTFREDQIGLEWFLGYIACTRARRQVLTTYSQRDLEGTPLNPSPFIQHLQRLFPGLVPEEGGRALDWRQSVHPNELVVPLLKNRGENPTSKVATLGKLEQLPLFSSAFERWDQIACSRSIKRLSPGLPDQLYGSELKTSISNLEDYAACPFKFFVVRGLRAEEREKFQADSREHGSFQHEILKEFQVRLKQDGKRWRAVTPAAASELIARIGADLQKSFRDGLFESAPERRFVARANIDHLRKFIGVLVRWAHQYDFEPQAAELGFGLDETGLKPWKLELGGGRALLLRGRIDRVDLLRGEGDEVFAVVIDYKSGGQKLEEVKLINGLDLQLLAYLGVLRNATNAKTLFGTSKLVPAGAFYVGLRSRVRSAKTRTEALEKIDVARQTHYQHRGRFRSDLLSAFDNREAPKGDQFLYSLKKDGGFTMNGNEGLPAKTFVELVQSVEKFLHRYGREIYDGHVQALPYRHKNQTACERCIYSAICRFDPWVDSYRGLKSEP